MRNSLGFLKEMACIPNLTFLWGFNKQSYGRNLDLIFSWVYILLQILSLHWGQLLFWEPFPKRYLEGETVVYLDLASPSFIIFSLNSVCKCNSFLALYVIKAVKINQLHFQLSVWKYSQLNLGFLNAFLSFTLSQAAVLLIFYYYITCVPFPPTSHHDFHTIFPSTIPSGPAGLYMLTKPIPHVLLWQYPLLITIYVLVIYYTVINHP